jgi:hypothetical protein
LFDAIIPRKVVFIGVAGGSEPRLPWQGASRQPKASSAIVSSGFDLRRVVQDHLEPAVVGTYRSRDAETAL